MISVIQELNLDPRVKKYGKIAAGVGAGLGAAYGGYRMLKGDEEHTKPVKVV